MRRSRVNFPFRFARFVGAAFLLLAAAAPTLAGAGDDKPADRRVFVLGDSVVVGAQGAIAARLGASGWQVTQVAAESQHTYTAPGVIDANAAAIGDTVVVSLGTNDGMTPDQFAGWIDDLMSALRGVENVYWVNLRQFADWVPASNAELEAAEDRWPNLQIIDWDARSSGDRSLVAGDGIHLTTTGQDAFAELIGSTLDEEAGVTPPPTSPSTTSTTQPLTTAAPTTTDASGDGGGGGGLDPAWVVVGGSVVVAGAGLVAVNRRRPR